MHLLLKRTKIRMCPTEVVSKGGRVNLRNCWPSCTSMASTFLALFSSSSQTLFSNSLSYSAPSAFVSHSSEPRTYTKIVLRCLRHFLGEDPQELQQACKVFRVVSKRSHNRIHHIRPLDHLNSQPSQANIQLRPYWSTSGTLSVCLEKA
jgi:hypothetical protein